jgi:hypothetical protein
METDAFNPSQLPHLVISQHDLSHQLSHRGTPFVSMARIAEYRRDIYVYSRLTQLMYRHDNMGA